MNDVELKAKKAAYAREWRAGKKEHLKQYRANSLASLKCCKEKYLEFRAAANERTMRYAKSHDAELKKRAADKNHYYTPERGKMLRNRYGVKYATQVSMKSARKRADEKGQPFDLTPEWYDAEFEKGCAVTGLPLDPNGSKTPFTAHVDKIIPALGYLKSNCRLVCACYNLAKKHWTDADVLRMAKALVLRNADE